MNGKDVLVINGKHYIVIDKDVLLRVSDFQPISVADEFPDGFICKRIGKANGVSINLPPYTIHY